MNANMRFLQQPYRNYWLDRRSPFKGSGLLEGIDKKYSRQQTAVLLESQRLWNEINPTQAPDQSRP